MTEGLYGFSRVRIGARTLQSRTSATFAFGGKFMGGKFAEAPDGGFFGPEALRGVCYVTEAVNLLRILTLTA